MRLDLVLKQSGIIKRRTIAKELCDAGKIEINNKVAKASSDVDDGDILTLHFGSKITNVEISYILRKGKEIPVYDVVKGIEAN